MESTVVRTFGAERKALLLPIAEQSEAPSTATATAGAEAAPPIPTDTLQLSTTEPSATPLVQTLGDDSSSIVFSTDLRDAERLLDVQEMLTTVVGTSSSTLSANGLAAPEPLQVAPYTHVPKRTARYRIPRHEKSRLLDRFCGVKGKTAGPRTLLIIAHPDDESIGAGARLAELGEAWVTYTTDGAPRNPEVARRHGFDSREQYAEQRHREALKALSIAGIGADRVSYLGVVDGEACQNLVELCLRTADLLDRIQPDVVVTHPYEGGHTDHDATAFAVHLACGVLCREGVKPPAVFEMSSYNAINGERVVQEFVPHRRADLERRLVPLGGKQRQLKARMYACFATQQRVLGEFSTEFEKFRPAPRYVFTRPPHEGILNYERYGDPGLGRRFRAEAEDALRELRVRRRAG